ncbi:MAG TPA: polyphosphate kinase 1 [Candidatus Saccharimonadales bacterium]|nr:polyphosphate kinase 1 [Candidatus Saccharimonadales bacterium]
MALAAPEDGADADAPQRDHAEKLDGRHRYINRHLSWLDYDTRVLELAEDPSRVLLDRAKFVAISSTNLDEFFQVRVGGLIEQRRAGVAALSPDGMTVDEQLTEIRTRCTDITARQIHAFRDIVEQLADVGLRFSNNDSLDPGDREYVDSVFEDRIFPVLTPLAVDPAHPFPYISDLSLNLAVVVGAPRGAEQRIARVKVPPLLPRFVVMPDGERFVPVEQVIASHLDRLFPGMRVVAQYPFRVTRNADPALEEEEAEDLRAAVQEYLRRRRRSPQVVRLEIDDSMSEEVKRLLMRELELGEEDVYTVAGPLDLSGLWGLYELNRPDLKERLPAPVIPLALTLPPGEEGEIDIFKVIDAGDVLVQHPYESFASSVEAFIDQAVSDPDVLAIKQTLYRTSGPDSPIVRALIRAAERGKQVVALVELTARFDEQQNITWAEELEKAGVHVVYGVVGLKTHAKATLVVRRSDGGIRRYCHMGTGNYNSQTARLYEDIGLLTSNVEIGEDLTDLFNYLTGYSRQRQYRRLLVAPVTLRPGIVELIRTQTHSEGRIIIKCNHLIDPEVIEALYAASCAGARIDLIVRSSCGVRPGIAGMSENIWVRSLCGRYLEHSRLYHFGPDTWYIGSADLMGRNLDGRIETVVPVLDPLLQARLAEIIDVLLADDVLASELHADGTWHHVPRVRGLDAQAELHRLAVERVAR